MTYFGIAPLSAIATAQVNHLSCWRFIPLACRSRTNREIAMKSPRVYKSVRIGLAMPFGKIPSRSSPSGFSMGPSPWTDPGENATKTAPVRTTPALGHETHRQRLVGSRPWGNSRPKNT
jgi:hypothetical protein